MIKSASMTKYTREVMQGKREPSIDMSNRKPFRSEHLRSEARKVAVKHTEGRYRGTYTSSGLKSYHPPVK